MSTQPEIPEAREAANFIAVWNLSCVLQAELAVLRKDVKPLLEYLQHGPVGQSKVREFLATHPEFKEKP